MRLSLTRPSPDTLRQLAEVQSDCELTYTETGASSRRLPAGYWTDEVRICLGNDEGLFELASEVVFRWRQFQTGWTHIFPANAPICTGQTVAVMARLWGLWSLHACRIVEVVDEADRRGFAYGTLPAHAETGEECFLVERLADGSVWYEVRAFFRPRDWRVRVLWPLLRHAMNRFRRNSADAVSSELQTR